MTHSTNTWIDQTDPGTHEMKAELTLNIVDNNNCRHFLPLNLVPLTLLETQRGCFWVFQQHALCLEGFS